MWQLRVINLNKMKPAPFVASVVLLVAGVVMYLLTRGADIPVLHPSGPIALAEYRVILVTFLLSALIIVPVFFLLFFFSWRYRAQGPDTQKHHHPTWDHENAAVEFLWWLIPAGIIGVLSVVAWQSSHALDPYVRIPGERTVEVQVVALQWKWLFIYPELGLASVNELVIPVGTPVHFSLTGDAPINSFWIPSLGGQIMVMQGMQTQLNLLASEAGTFEGWSGNLSGRGFSKMMFKVRALPTDQYESWVERAQHDTTTPLNAENYVSLSAPTEGHSVTYYYPVDPDLYTSIHTKYMSAPVAEHSHSI